MPAPMSLKIINRIIFIAVFTFIYLLYLVKVINCLNTTANLQTMDFMKSGTTDMDNFLNSPFVQKVLKPLIILVGSFFSAKAAIILTSTFNYFTKTYVMPKIDKKYSLRKEFGEYVVLTNVTDILGTEFAKAFLLKRHSLVLIVQNNDKKLEHIMPDLEKCKAIGGGEIVVITEDVSKGDMEVYQKLGEQLSNVPYRSKIGILVNVAGFMGSHDEYLLRYSDKYVLDLVHRCITDFMMVTKEILEIMHENKRGLIVNVTSPDDCDFFETDSGFPLTLRHFTEEFNEIVRKEFSDIQKLEVEAIHPGCICIGGDCSSSSMNPTPEKFVRSAMTTIGRAKVSTGYPYHSFRNFVNSMFPNFLKEIIHNVFEEHPSSQQGYTAILGKGDPESGRLY